MFTGSIKISELDALGTVVAADFFPLVQSGSLTTFRVNISTLNEWFSVSGSVLSASWASASINSIQTTADDKGVKIAMNCPDIILLHDSERIVQVLTNLLKNSLIAVNENTGAIQINVGDYPSEIKISVNDNGMGIPAEKQKDLFKKFYQVDATLTRERGGSGLGLAIVKGIIIAHGGKIGVQSSPNVGTTITFTIPKN